MAKLTPIDAADFVSMLGGTFIKHERQTLLALPGSNVAYDRVTLGLIGCPHAAAALRINRVFQELRIRTLEGLARELQTLGRFKGLGTTSYFVALAILKQNGYNVQDLQKLHGDDVTVSALKTRAKKARAKRPAKRPRRAGPPSESAGGE